MLSLMAKLNLMPTVDLVKVLIKCYNPINKSFDRKDRSVFLALDKDTFIEAFDLGGPMSLTIDIEDLSKNFKSHKNFHMGKNMTLHILKVKKEVEEIPKKRDVDEVIPLDFF